MGEHLVQFYNDEAYLVEEIWSFISPGLQLGEAAVVIATRERLEHIEHLYAPSRLIGIDHAEGGGPYFALDAESVLASILEEGRPDAARFDAVIGEILRKASRNGLRHVRAYGEMVASLCIGGKADAALTLEDLWNRIGERYPLSLLCGYPMHAFAGEAHCESFSRICCAHSHVRPAEHCPEIEDRDALNRTIATLQQKAHALESEVARRKSIEHSLHECETQLAELDRRKDEFLAMLGHELRNPLAPIVNSLELMRLQSKSSEHIARYRETIARQVSLMTRLVDDLLDVSRITRGKIALKKEATTLDHVVERAVEMVRPLIDERGQVLVITLPPAPIALIVDPARLTQVIANLLHNAAKYTDNGGWIGLLARTFNDTLEIVVADNGAGIDKAKQEKIFDLFVQDTDSLPDARGGLGLGLTLVRSLIRLHGGEVRVHSEGRGRGSEFTVTLPLRVADMPR